MLNCVGISREKQQTWQDWLTILLSWDTIKRKPVSLGGCARLMLASRPPVSVSWCWCYIAAVSFMLAAANSCNTGNSFLSFSPLLMTEHIMAPDVCMFAELFKSPVFCSDTQHARCFSWISRNFFFLAFLPPKKRKKEICHILSPLSQLLTEFHIGDMFSWVYKPSIRNLAMFIML